MPSESGEGASLTAKGKEDLVSEIGSPGPFSVSTRVGIMTALLGSKRATFTELLLVVKTPKSSLNKKIIFEVEDKESTALEINEAIGTRK